MDKVDVSIGSHGMGPLLALVLLCEGLFDHWWSFPDPGFLSSCPRTDPGVSSPSQSSAGFR